MPRTFSRTSSRTALLLTTGLLSGMVGCSTEAPPALTVGDIAYSEAELLGLTPSSRDMLAQLTAFGISLSRNEAEALFAPAIEIGLADLLYRRTMAERLLEDAGMDDGALRRLYELEPEWELSIRHLIVFSGRYETPPMREAARQKAERALERIRAGEPFGQVAAEVSDEPGAEGRQGLLNPGREGAWVKEFWAAGVALEVGAISEVVETQYGFHVLRLEDRQPVPFEEARAALTLRLATERGLAVESSAQAPRPTGASFAPDLGSIQDPAAPVAEWEDGHVTFENLIDRAAATGGREWDLFQQGDLATRGAMLDLELARASALGLAAAAGIEATDADRATLVREWTDRFEQTGQLLGMTPGLPSTEVKAAALQALGRSGQNADLSRSAVRNWRGLLELRHRFAAAMASETAPVATP